MPSGCVDGLRCVAASLHLSDNVDVAWLFGSSSFFNCHFQPTRAQFRSSPPPAPLASSSLLPSRFSHATCPASSPLQSQCHFPIQPVDSHLNWVRFIAAAPVHLAERHTSTGTTTPPLAATFAPVSSRTLLDPIQTSFLPCHHHLHHHLHHPHHRLAAAAAASLFSLPSSTYLHLCYHQPISSVSSSRHRTYDPNGGALLLHSTRLRLGRKL